MTNALKVYCSTYAGHWTQKLQTTHTITMILNMRGMVLFNLLDFRYNSLLEDMIIILKNCHHKEGIIHPKTARVTGRRMQRRW